MIKMAMSQDDGFQRLRRQPQPAEKPPHKDRLTGQPGVQQHTLVAVVEQKTAAHETADRKQIRRNVAHVQGLTDGLANRSLKNLIVLASQSMAKKEDAARVRAA
jgi:hypothetical protein